jgi:hypothetical protein
MYENRHARFTAVDPLLTSSKLANTGIRKTNPMAFKGFQIHEIQLGWFRTRTRRPNFRTDKLPRRTS